jgi:hypothetical protein
MYAPGASRRRAMLFLAADLTRRCVSPRLYFRLFPLFYALYFRSVLSFDISITCPVFGRSDVL